MIERDFIALLRGAASNTAARGLVDDAAVFGDLVLTHDMMIEHVHWLDGAAPEDVAAKLVARNLSDLAAKGASPLGVLLGFVLGDEAWDRRFATGLGDTLSRFGTELWGGDTAASGRSSDARVLGMTAIGRAVHQPVPARHGARPGDALWVTGTLGLAYAGYRHDADGKPASDDAIARFRRPVPRLVEGKAVAPQVTAMMDISDGLLLDATRLADAGGVTVALERASIPLAAELAAADRAAALRWGDDYELLFTLPDGVEPAAPATRIGEVRARGAAALLLDGVPPGAAQLIGWQHRAPQRDRPE